MSLILNDSGSFSQTEPNDKIAEIIREIVENIQKGSAASPGEGGFL
jgi:hypothetical protein